MSTGDEIVSERLTDRLSGFCEYLRVHGFFVGVGAEVDLAQAIGAISLLDRGQFRAACAVTLAKSPEDLQLVTACFDRFWSGNDPVAPAPWPAMEVVALAPPKRSAPVARHRVEGTPEENPPTVAIPIGTYSASAPSALHPIVPVSERQLRAVRNGARRFRRQNATLPGRRRGASHRGSVDLRDTVRRSLHHGGEWLELRHRQRRRSRADFMILWDVSGSMREHESRFFALVHALGSISRRSRVFAFSTQLDEITDDVRRFGYRRAAAVIARRVERADGGTRIGHSLREFTDRYGGALGERTTLVVLSDGWDLGDPGAVGEMLRRLARRTFRIVWVTPYTRRPGFQPQVGALRSALGEIDQLLGPEDFESRQALRPFRA